MDINKFTLKFIEDMSREFGSAKIKGESIRVGTNDHYVSFSIRTIFQEYSLSKDYDMILNSHKSMIAKTLRQSFVLEYDNVYPIIKHKSFGLNEDMCFVRDDLFLNYQVLYVSDCGDLFRFICKDDEPDRNKLRVAAFNNLNKLTNMLSKLDNSMEIYSLKFTSDFGSALLLNDSIKTQISKKVGDDYLIAMPSASTLLIAKYTSFYVEILERLIRADSESDPNRLTNEIIRCNRGKYTVVSTDKANITCVK